MQLLPGNLFLTTCVLCLVVFGSGLSRSAEAAEANACDRPWAFAPQVQVQGSVQRQDADRISGRFYVARTGEGEPAVAAHQTSVWLAWTKERLLMWFRCEEPNMDDLVTVYRGPDLWKNDCLEIFLRPNPDRAEYLHFTVDAAGRGYARDRIHLEKDTIPNEKWTYEVSRDKSAWTVKVAIPWSVMQATPLQGRQIRASFGRERRAGGTGVKLSTWTPPFGFNKPTQFGHIVLGKRENFLRNTLGKIRPALSELKKTLSASADNHRASARATQTSRAWQRVVQQGRQLLDSSEPEGRAFRQWARLYCQAKQHGQPESLVYEIKIHQLLQR